MVIRAGATVKSAVAINGQVILEPGAAVTHDALAVGGDLQLSDGSRMGKDAVALGGRLLAGPRSKIAGHRVALSIGGAIVKSVIAEVARRAQKNSRAMMPAVVV